ncbi:deoxyribodipyrimidine photo-lyase [Saccharomonospora amisosensis]|uniref:Deoxyribodipyrimidine photo-lyase n=1 Tax=Saccharomonospora amisosensis TaxID=1128677 RepID=A0A7X5UPC8_9PSEU|nr:deoxyribodipyrimidine photo-lyase [Saccharomonospora amisosensis]
MLDESILRSDYNRPNRACFLADCLRDLDARLRELGARLVIRRGHVPEVVAQLAEEHAAKEVHISSDVSSYAKGRETALRNSLRDNGRTLVIHDGVINVVSPGLLVPAARDHYAMFTPYFRRWSEAPMRSLASTPPRLRMPRIEPGTVPSASEICTGQPSSNLPPGGEQAARAKLDAWLSGPLRVYHRVYDSVADDATSRLSPHLHFGSLSATELVARTGRSSAGAHAFVRQLAWRDFFHQVLAARPSATSQDYRPRGGHWRTCDREMAAWRDGRTGFPIVDAGMRQLSVEGWMHNRARLIVASFLTKTLYLDWRWGARHFRDLLVDADMANNQLNWQWVAGTGTDSRPNRVLNPLLQARRYDPDGDYVRRYVPELADVPGAAVHMPWELRDRERARLDYPDPIVDLRQARARFLEARGKRRYDSAGQWPCQP